MRMAGCRVIRKPAIGDPLMLGYCQIFCLIVSRVRRWHFGLHSFRKCCHSPKDSTCYMMRGSALEIPSREASVITSMKTYCCTDDIDKMQVTVSILSNKF